MALKNGMRLIRTNPAHPEDGADAELVHRVKAAVIARLSDQVDAKLLDAVVTYFQTEKLKAETEKQAAAV